MNIINLSFGGLITTRSQNGQVRRRTEMYISADGKSTWLAPDWPQCFQIGGALQTFLCSINLSSRQSWAEQIPSVQDGEGSQGSVLVATTYPEVMVGAEPLLQQGTEGTCPPLTSVKTTRAHLGFIPTHN